MKAVEKVAEHLCYMNIGMIDGVTTFTLAERTNLHINTVRHTLRQLARQGRAYSCAPRKHDRLDGKTAGTLVWFKPDPSYWREKMLAGR